MDFGQTIWIPVVVTVLVSIYSTYQYNWSKQEPEVNGKFLFSVVGIIVLWATFLFLWGLLIFVEQGILPLVNYLSCTCKLF